MQRSSLPLYDPKNTCKKKIRQSKASAIVHAERELPVKEQYKIDLVINMGSFNQHVQYLGGDMTILKYFEHFLSIDRFNVLFKREQINENSLSVSGKACYRQ